MSKLSRLIMSCALWAAQAIAQAPEPTQLHSPYSAEDLYNVGNSYARAGKPGLAVLSYERAALLAPGDADINANLVYVRIAAHVPSKPRSPFARFIQWTSPTAAAWLGVLGLALLGAALVTRKRAPQLRWTPVGGILVGAALIGLGGSHAMLEWPRVHEAVVLIDQTAARVSPAPMADTAFVLREAESVTMTAQHEDFVLVRTDNGRSGWISRANLGAVVPTLPQR